MTQREVSLFYLEVGGSKLLQNINKYLPDCKASHPRRHLFAGLHNVADDYKSLVTQWF
jgi:DNA-binding sugar fermentation-stimulating protein